MIDYKSKSFYIVLLAFGGLLKIFLESWFQIEITADKLNSLVNLISFIVIMLVLPANTWFTKRRQEQKKVLKEQGLK